MTIPKITKPQTKTCEWESAIMFIDPDTACALLELNFQNRKVRNWVVRRYERTMGNKEWVLTPESIIFAGDPFTDPASASRRDQNHPPCGTEQCEFRSFV